MIWKAWPLDLRNQTVADSASIGLTNKLQCQPKGKIAGPPLGGIHLLEPTLYHLRRGTYIEISDELMISSSRSAKGHTCHSAEKAVLFTQCAKIVGS